MIVHGAIFARPNAPVDSANRVDSWRNAGPTPRHASYRLLQRGVLDGRTAAGFLIVRYGETAF